MLKLEQNFKKIFEKLLRFYGVFTLRKFFKIVSMCDKKFEKVLQKFHANFEKILRNFVELWKIREC